MRLHQILDESGFDWVVEQVDLEVATGKIGRRESPDLPFSTDFGVLQPRTGRSKPPLTTEPYSEAESLRLLLDAVMEATSVLSAVSAAVVGLTDSGEIRFTDETTGEPTELGPLAAQHKSLSSELLGPLSELRAEVAE